METNRPEILAPAGDEAMLRAAVFAGADSVYLGFSGFNARSSAGNFTAGTLPGAVAFCHARGVRVDVALNTLCMDSELDALQQAVEAVAAAGADAVIVQDLAAADLVRRCAPGLLLYGSTQMSVMNTAGAKLLAQNGFSRVILARELTAAEAAAVTRDSGIETEVFVHGALCMSVSGQCAMSAFFGGRSANRGSCAGPCRLPYLFDGREKPYLSLHDLSILDRLPELAEMGVASVKIEGRLRTPEYVAAAVSAARAARDGRSYDRGLLMSAFSRSGFTDGFWTGRYLEDGMFGARTEADAADTRRALPALHELYRRERQSVPVRFSFSAEEDGSKLAVSDRAGNRCIVYDETAPLPSRQPADELKAETAAALEKCGGTPFFAEKTEICGPAGTYLPAAVLNRMRRTALEQLLAKRSEPRPVPFRPVRIPAVTRRPSAGLSLRLRFLHTAQCTTEAAALADALLLPASEAASVPPEFRRKTILFLPRAVFREEEVRGLVRAAAGEGFAAFEAENIGEIPLIREEAPGAVIHGGSGLNVTNRIAAERYAELGLSSLILSPEITLGAANRIAGRAYTGLLAYGRLPLMLTRACPVRGQKTCAQCGGRSSLGDRTGRRIRILCSGTGPNGARELLNPVPLWLGDRRQEIGTDFAVLYYTEETPARALQIAQMFRDGCPFDGELTRGLYDRGVAGLQR